MNSFVRALTSLSHTLNSAVDIQRFPPPEFEGGHALPQTTTPMPHSEFFEYLDVAVLVGALSLASYFVYTKRSRSSVFYLSIFSLIYFGFFREGCICSIGAIQNVTLALFDQTYAIPLVALAFFLLPLLFSLFFGRVFCAGVCPLGAIQDLVLIRPIKVPYWLQQALSLFAYVYLGAAVLFAALGSAFIICEYDPFVSFFRLSGNLSILLLGTFLLVIGLFVGRPYCLYLCPYSVILRFLSRFSQWNVIVTPDSCVTCQRCEDACPYGAIVPPTPKDAPSSNAKDRKRLILLLLTAPVIIAFAAWVTSFAGASFSRMDYTVRLAEQIIWEETEQVEVYTDASAAFRDTGQPKEELFEKARLLRERYTLGAWILGAFIGLVIVCKLIEQSVFTRRSEFEVNPAGCLACGRCFASCPLERKRRRECQAAIPAKGGAAVQ